MLDDRFLDLLRALVRQPSVVGAEHAFFRVLQRELEERGAEVKWYEGVLVAQGPRAARQPGDGAMLSAHVDRHGLVCTGPNEFQYAAFVAGNRTDLLGNSVSEEMMSKVAGRFSGRRVFAYEPWSGAYVGHGTIEGSSVCPMRNNLIFEVQGLGHVVAGTPVAFEDNLAQVDGRLEGQLDNVLTAAVLVHLFDLGFEGTAFFTAQEEAGKSWRYLLEWFRRFGQSTNNLLVLDTSPFQTVEEANRQQVVLRTRDANAGFNVEATAALAALCTQRGFEYLYKDRLVDTQNADRENEGKRPRSVGSTEMGRIIAASQGLVDGTTLQVPTIGYHTVAESAAVESVDVFIRLVTEVAAGVPGAAR